MTSPAVPCLPLSEPASSAPIAPWDPHVTGHGPYLVQATLTGGLRVAIRPLRPSDREQFAAGHEHLSGDTQYRRYLVPKPRLSGRELEVLVDGVDQDQHLALALVWPRTSRADVLLGEARAIRLKSQPDTADVAVTITDELQGQGAGRLMMRVLADTALEHGITRFTAVLLASNTASGRLLTRLGPVERDVIESGLRDLTVQLAVTPAALAAPHAA